MKRTRRFVLAVLLLSSSEPFHVGFTPRPGRVRAGRGRGDRGAARARRRVGAPPRPRLPSTGLYPARRDRPSGLLGFTAGAVSRTPPGLLRQPTSPRSVLGNSDLPQPRRCAAPSPEGTGWLAQIGLFRDARPLLRFARRGLGERPVVPALVAGAVLLLGRPAALRGSRPPCPSGVPWRGAGVPLLVGSARGGAHRGSALIALTEGRAPNATALVDVVFVLVVVPHAAARHHSAVGRPAARGGAGAGRAA